MTVQRLYEFQWREEDQKIWTKTVRIDLKAYKLLIRLFWIGLNGNLKFMWPIQFNQIKAYGNDDGKKTSTLCNLLGFKESTCSLDS